MISRFTDLERKTLLVQFIAVEPLTFYSTSDGTDLVQDILRSQLARSDADIFGQEGSLTIDEQGEFLAFEPSDSKNRTLHLPVEHLAYCGALRRMRRDTTDQRDPDQIHRREFENVDLANRFAHQIVGPPIFVAVFHGFDNALCYTFVTQSADDACLLVMKLMRTFKMREHQLEQQGQGHAGISSLPSHPTRGPPSPVSIREGGSPFAQPSQSFFTDNRQILPSPAFHQAQNSAHPSFVQDTRHDELIQRLLSDPNLQIVNQSAPFHSQRPDDIQIMSNSGQMAQRSSSYDNNNRLSPFGGASQMGRSIPQSMRPPSPPILGISDGHMGQNSALSNSNPQIIYKPNNQEVVYKQNIMVRWLQPPTPPPPAPIIIREIQGPVETQPPIVCRQMPPCPRTPPPIIVREKPPPCPPIGQPLIIEKRLPAVTMPRQVIVERYPAPPAKPPTIIYEKYMPNAQPPRQVLVRREVCQPNCYPVTQHPAPGRRLVREIIRQVPQTSAAGQPALVCVPQQQQQQFQQQQPAQSNTFQQLVPVYATRQQVIQPQGVRVIRQVIGPAQMPLQHSQQMYASNGSPFIQTVQPTYMQ